MAQKRGNTSRNGPNSDYEQCEKRAGWLNQNVFASRPIDADAVAAMAGMGRQRAMELFKEIEEKGAAVRNPSGYLKSAAMKEGLAPPETIQSAPMLTAPKIVGAPARAIGSKVQPQAKTAPPKQQAHAQHVYQDQGQEETKIRRRVTWLNANVFSGSPIDQEALGAMLGMGSARAMELFKEIEEKSDKVRNPSGYLKTAAMKEGFAPVEMMMQAYAGGYGYGDAESRSRIQKRVAWLNGNVFLQNPIDEETVEVMAASVEVKRAMELFKEIEGKPNVKNPSGYLKAAVSREAAGMAAVLPSEAEQTKVSRRATWLNANVFKDNPIDSDAIGAMMGMGADRAMQLFKDLEAKGAEIRNPSNWLKGAAMREGFAPVGHAGYSGHGGHGGHAAASLDQDGARRVRRRVAWLNENVFMKTPLDEDTIEAMQTVAINRAMEIMKELEGKGTDVKNPSAYLQAAASREGGCVSKRPRW